MPQLEMSSVWLILFVVFLVMELITSGSLVSIWFCFGSLAAMVAAGSGFSLLVQIVVFIVVSIALLIMTKPIVKKFLVQKKVPTNADRIIGQRGFVIEDINNISGQGIVKVDGKQWSAKNALSDETIEAGQEVIIVEISGVKVFVKKV